MAVANRLDVQTSGNEADLKIGDLSVGINRFPPKWEYGKIMFIRGADDSVEYSTEGRATDSDGVAIVDRPVEVSNLFATLYKSLGIEPDRELRSPNGRPIKLTGIFGDGEPINEIL